MTKDYGFLQHGEGSAGPSMTEKVTIKLAEWPNTGRWLAHYEGRWRVVHQNLSRLWIVYAGKKITIRIWGV